MLSRWEFLSHLDSALLGIPSCVGLGSAAAIAGGGKAVLGGEKVVLGGGNTSFGRLLQLYQVSGLQVTMSCLMGKSVYKRQGIATV